MSGVYRDPMMAGDDNGSNGYSGKPSLIREYLGTEPRKLLYSSGFILGVIVVVTIPYVLLVGYSKWKSDMKEAGHMMWAGYTPAAANAWAPPQTYSVVPAAATPAMQVPMPAPAPTPGPSFAPSFGAQQLGLGRQYICPSCGAVGLPSWTSAGQPVCPMCGNTMYVAPMRMDFELAATPAAFP
jgi:hypothetical protein